MNILLIDDDHDSRSCVGDFLRDLGHVTVECENGRDGLETFKAGKFQMVLSDIRMPGISGLELLRALTSLPNREEFDVVLFTGHGDMQSAVEALRAGAYDYLLKPINVEELASITERIAERQALRRENRLLTERFEEEVKAATAETKEELSRLKKAFCKTVGLGSVGVFSEAMREVFRKADMLHADRSIPVLIQGETGTGKEVAARYIHYGGGDVTAPFIDINCAAITPAIFESEIFGYESGAFTGGLPRGQKGKLDLAQGGTIFLDEIGEIPVDLQAKLLRVIQEREYYRVGGLKKIRADVRLICATNVDLEKKVAAGLFRADLYYRLNVGSICIPPLRERTEDILPLAAMFLAGFAREKGKTFKDISREAADMLISHNWPGNVRELRNTIEWAVLMGSGPLLKASHLDALQRGLVAAPVKEDGPAGVASPEHFSLPTDRLPLEQFIDSIVIKALQLNKGNITRTARYLDLSRRALYSRLKRVKYQGRGGRPGL